MVMAPRHSPSRRGKDTLKLHPFSVRVAVDLSDLACKAEQTQSSSRLHGRHPNDNHCGSSIEFLLGPHIQSPRKVAFLAFRTTVLQLDTTVTVDSPRDYMV